MLFYVGCQWHIVGTVCICSQSGSASSTRITPSILLIRSSVLVCLLVVACRTFEPLADTISIFRRCGQSPGPMANFPTIIACIFSLQFVEAGAFLFPFIILYLNQKFLPISIINSGLCCRCTQCVSQLLQRHYNMCQQPHFFS